MKQATLMISMPQKTKDELLEYCEQEDRTASSVVRVALKKHLGI